MAETRKMTLGIQDVEDLDQEVDPMPTEPMTLNMGPSHPAMHGTVRIILTVEGETVKDADVQVGYLHRCFEKESEHATYTQVFPYTDRLNYVSPMLNNVGYALAVEKLLGIAERVPERAQYIRVIVGELSRIADHLTCMSAGAMELGAMTIYFWGIKAREWIWEMLEELSGARMTHSYVRVGGLAYDLTPDFIPKVLALFPKINVVLKDIHDSLWENRIFRDRMDGTGVITQERALQYGWTGPCLRSTGIDYDVRKAHPYLVYDRFDFDVPIGSKGDNFDRYIVRMEEARQSMRILEQAFKQIPEGPVCLDDPRIILPPKADVYNSIEGMISHFKIIVDGVKVPPGEVYSYTEGGNGELAFYIVSDGTGRPYKCRVRGPCFIITSALQEMIVNKPIADIVPTFDMMNMIGGECDR
ncbi:MAG TPA: NADH-quinone oxidoreductase subunit D [Polyangia bacterium]